MSIQYNESASTNTNGANPVSASWIDLGTSEVNLNTAVAGSQTNFDVPLSFNGANLQSMILVSNQPVTIKVNSTGSPFSTINLVAGVPFLYSAAGGYYSNPLNVAVTHFYVTTTAPALIKAKFLIA